MSIEYIYFGVLLSDLFATSVPLVKSPAYGTACPDHRHMPSEHHSHLKIISECGS